MEQFPIQKNKKKKKKIRDPPVIQVHSTIGKLEEDYSKLELFQLNGRQRIDLLLTYIH